MTFVIIPDHPYLSIALYILVPILVILLTENYSKYRHFKLITKMEYLSDVVTNKINNNKVISSMILPSITILVLIPLSDPLGFQGILTYTLTWIGSSALCYFLISSFNKLNNLN